MNIKLCNPFQISRFFLWLLIPLLFAMSDAKAQTFNITPTGPNTFSIQVSNVYAWEIQELVSNNWTRIDFGGGSPPILNYTRPPGTYYFRLYNCYNIQGGCSTSSSKSITIVPLTLSAPTLNVTGIENTASNIDTNGVYSFTWNSVTGADNYALEADGGAIYYGSGVTHALSNVGFGPHTFRVKACRDNATVCSGWSNSITITTQYPQPSLPSGPSFSGLENASTKTDNDGVFTISWGESTWVENYLLQRNGIDWYWGPNRSFSVSGLQPGVYTYQVKACRDWATNCSSYTASQTITVVAPTPSSSSRSSSSVALTSSSRSSSSIAMISTSSSRSSSSTAIISTSSSRSSSSVALASSSPSSSSASIQPKTVRYTYDALGRLTFVDDSQNGNRDYDYDAAGNRLLVSTAVANDTAAEPNVLLPAPTNLYKSQIYSCAWKATWNLVTGAAKYLVKDTSGASQWVTTTEAVVACPVGNSSGNMPQSVQACTANNVCGPQANF